MVDVEQFERWSRAAQLQGLCGNSFLRTAEVRYHLDDTAGEQFHAARDYSELYGRARYTFCDPGRIHGFGQRLKDRGGENRPGLRA